MSLTTFVFVAVAIPLSMIACLVLIESAVERGGVYKHLLVVLVALLAVVSMFGSASDVASLLGGHEPTGVTGRWGVWVQFAITWLYFSCIVWAVHRVGGRPSWSRATRTLMSRFGGCEDLSPFRGW